MTPSVSVRGSQLCPSRSRTTARVKRRLAPSGKPVPPYSKAVAVEPRTRSWFRVRLVSGTVAGWSGAWRQGWSGTAGARRRAPAARPSAAARTQARPPARTRARPARVLGGRPAYRGAAGAAEPTSRTRHTAATRTDRAGGACPTTRPGTSRVPAGMNPLAPTASPLPALMSTQAQANRRLTSTTTEATAGVASSGATPWRMAAPASPSRSKGAARQGARPVADLMASTVGTAPATRPSTTATRTRLGQMVRAAPAAPRVRAATSRLWPIQGPGLRTTSRTRRPLPHKAVMRTAASSGCQRTGSAGGVPGGAAPMRSGRVTDSHPEPYPRPRRARRPRGPCAPATPRAILQPARRPARPGRARPPRAGRPAPARRRRARPSR